MSFFSSKPTYKNDTPTTDVPADDKVFNKIKGFTFYKNTASDGTHPYTWKLSESRQFLLLWSDFDCEFNSGFGGCRKKGHGRVFLFDVLSGVKMLELNNIESPKECHISDSGIFTITDGLFGDKLHGKYYIYSSSGECLAEYLVRANICGSFIFSDDYSGFHTCSSKNRDSNIDVLFDMRTGELITRSLDVSMREVTKIDRHSQIIFAQRTEHTAQFEVECNFKGKIQKKQYN